MIDAVVSQIQRFSVGDGPGIRTTVFFKGCNLHCPWCHNPETIRPAPEILYYHSRCTGCGRCAALCGRHRMTPEGHGFDRDGCVVCGRCTAQCPSGALTLCGQRYTAAERMDLLLEDRDFYAASGGGVTLSGGEPLLQPAACAAIAAACQKEDIPVLLDTAGNVGYAAFEQVLPHLSLCYFDLKAGTQAGYDVVGGRLDRLCENLRRLTDDGVPTVVRIPLIPGFNDTPDETRRMAQIASSAGVTTVHLLPFHRLGSSKYAALGQRYGYASTLPPPAETIDLLLTIYRQQGLTALKGG